MGKTPIVKGTTLFIEPNDWFVPIKNEYPALEAEFAELELGKTPFNKAKTEALSSIRARWGDWRDLNP